jgi:molybdenum cofactor cytidylyltransferase
LAHSEGEGAGLDTAVDWDRLPRGHALVLCVAPGFVIESTLMRPESEGSTPVAAVILAAGGSARMGTTKQLLPIAGKPMLRLVAEAACSAGLDQVLVVVGANGDAVAEVLVGLPVEIVFNDAWSLGLSTSMRAGIGALRDRIQAVLFLLGDQVAVSTKLLQSLVDCYGVRRAAIVAPAVGGRRANPVLFDRSLLPELLEVEGDEGGRSVIARHLDQLELVAVQDPGLMLDVDTPDDYEQALSVMRRGDEGEAAGDD